MSRVLREGSTITARIAGRLRHVIIKTVTNQNSLVVRLGKNSNQSLHTVTRQNSTTTRGTMFAE